MVLLITQHYLTSRALKSLDLLRKIRLLDPGVLRTVCAGVYTVWRAALPAVLAKK